MTAAERIANDPRVTVAARIFMFATPVIVLAGLTIIGWVITSQAAARTALETRMTSVENFDGIINSRVSVLESTSVNNKANRDKQINDINARIDGNQSAVESKLDKLVDEVSDLKTEVAGLNATLKATSSRP